MSDLVGNPEDRFPHNEAHLWYVFTGVYMALLSIITIELVGSERLTPAFGLVTMFMGVMASVASPIGGRFNHFACSIILHGRLLMFFFF